MLGMALPRHARNVEGRMTYTDLCLIACGTVLALETATVVVDIRVDARTDRCIPSSQRQVDWYTSTGKRMRSTSDNIGFKGKIIAPVLEDPAGGHLCRGR